MKEVEEEEHERGGKWMIEDERWKASGEGRGRRENTG